MQAMVQVGLSVIIGYFFAALVDNLNRMEAMMEDEPKVVKHTVVVGDSLRLIALKYYGPGGVEFWKTIYDANKALIGENPYIIRPGQVLTIPEKPGPEEVSAEA